MVLRKRKGWVLAMLAALAAARGSGPGLWPPLPSPARRGVLEVSGRGASTPLASGSVVLLGLRPASNKGRNLNRTGPLVNRLTL